MRGLSTRQGIVAMEISCHYEGHSCKHSQQVSIDQILVMRYELTPCLAALVHLVFENRSYGSEMTCINAPPTLTHC